MYAKVAGDDETSDDDDYVYIGDGEMTKSMTGTVCRRPGQESLTGAKNGEGCELQASLLPWQKSLPAQRGRGKGRGKKTSRLGV